MKRRIAAGLSALALALSLTACGNPEQEQCVDVNGTKYVCDDDDDDSGWFPVFIPGIQPHHPSYSKPKPAYKAPAYRAPAYKAPSYRAPSFRSK